MKKYELTDETFIKGKTILYRIKSLIDISHFNVKAGDLGGFIEKEYNLSHEGNAWITDDAKVYDNAKIFHNAWIKDDAYVYENARIFDNAKISGNAWVCGNAIITGNVKVYGSAKISGNVIITDQVKIYGHANINYPSRVFCGNIEIFC